MTCRFCGAETPTLCDWPTQRPRLTPIQEIRHGDVILDGDDTRFEVYNITADDCEVITIHAVRIEKDRRAPRLYQLKGNTFFPTRVRREGEGACAAPCCELHLRELSETKHVCFDHWDSWRLQA